MGNLCGGPKDTMSRGPQIKAVVKERVFSSDTLLNRLFASDPCFCEYRDTCPKLNKCKEASARKQNVQVLNLNELIIKNKLFADFSKKYDRIYTSGKCQEGQGYIKSNKFIVEGWGRQLNSNLGHVYDGQILDGKMNGYGRLIFDPSSIDFEEDKTPLYYLGFFKDGMRHGEGTVYYVDESIEPFTTKWEKDQPAGMETEESNHSDHSVGKPMETMANNESDDDDQLPDRDFEDDDDQQPAEDEIEQQPAEDFEEDEEFYKN